MRHVNRLVPFSLSALYSACVKVRSQRASLSWLRCSTQDKSRQFVSDIGVSNALSCFWEHSWSRLTDVKLNICSSHEWIRCYCTRLYIVWSLTHVYGEFRALAMVCSNFTLLNSRYDYGEVSYQQLTRISGLWSSPVLWHWSPLCYFGAHALNRAPMFALKLTSFVMFSPKSTLLCCNRFLFPDSPANARFLTKEDKKLAVLRIKQNQTGVENKHFKWDQ